MPTYPNRPAMYRMARIDSEVRSGSFPSSKSMASAIEVSARTIQRDIEYMRDMLGAPLEYDAEQHGYRYTQEGFELTAAKITEGELVSILVGGKVLEEYVGTPFEADLRRAFSRIAMLLPEEVSLRVGELARATSFTITAPRPPEIDRFRILTEAVREHRRLRIEYEGLSGGHRGVRLVDPYHMACRDGAWYLLAFCHEQGEVRMFVPERMRDIAETGERFQAPAGFDLDAYMAGSFKVMRGGKPCRVRLLFTGWASRYVSERRWHPTQKVTWKKEDCLLELKVSSLDEVASWVMSFGGLCRVLGPEALRKKVMAGFRDGLANNNTPMRLRVGAKKSPAGKARASRGRR